MTKKFEYCVLSMTRPGGAYFEDASERLDKLGRIGWELVFIYSGKCFLKREMTEAETPKYEYTHVSVDVMYAPEEHTKVLTECGANGWRVMSTKTRVVDRTTKMIDYLLERPADALPFGMSSSEMNDLKVQIVEPYRGEVNKLEAKEEPPKGFVGHNPEPSVGPTIIISGPQGCGKSIISNAILDMLTNNKINWVQTRDDASIIYIQSNGSEIAAAMMRTKAEPAEPEVWDYSYFFSPEQVWVKSSIENIRILVNVAITNNVWFNYYPNTNNDRYPWLIVKKGMKNNIADYMRAHDMTGEIIPGQHMTADKL